VEFRARIVNAQAETTYSPILTLVVTREKGSIPA
jgi:hypothetical protein